MAIQSIKDVDLKELTSKIQEKVNTDYSYISRLLSDTEAILKKDFDVYIPEGMYVKIVGQKPEAPDQNTIYIPINLPRAEKKGELSDQELDLVAGGGQSVYTVPEEFLRTLPPTPLNDESMTQRAENIIPE